MTAAGCCPYCSQPLPEIRLGVRLTPLKARIFDLVQRGGADGIDREDLFDIVFGGTGRCRETLKAHIFQINELIADEGYRITGRSVARLEKLDENETDDLREHRGPTAISTATKEGNT
jgi:DNA-binding winged helix-turn-helix (wHTH) protein